jgi:hypothetical protein
MRIARRELRPCVANANNGATIKKIGRQAFILHPAAMHKRIFAGSAKPGLRSELTPRRHGARLSPRIDYMFSCTELDFIIQNDNVEL